MIIYWIKSIILSATLFAIRSSSLPYCGKNLKEKPKHYFLLTIRHLEEISIKPRGLKFFILLHVQIFYGVTGDAGDVLLMFSLMIP